MVYIISYCIKKKPYWHTPNLKKFYNIRNIKTTQNLKETPTTMILIKFLSTFIGPGVLPLIFNTQIFNIETWSNTKAMS